MSTFAAAIPGAIPGAFTNFSLNTSGDNGDSFELPWVSSKLTASLPFALGGFFGPLGGTESPNYVTGVDWELKVFSGKTLTYMTTIPRYASLSFSFPLNNEGSGQVVIDRTDPIFSATMGTGGPGTDLYNDENIWQLVYNGTPIFEFLGTTVDELIVDASSEAQPITLTGAGTARALSWAHTLPPGFPNIVYKLAALTDNFQLTSLNPQIWNLTSATDINAKNIYIDTANSAAAIVGTTNNYYSAPTLAAGPYDATSSAVSAKITPLNMPAQPVNLLANGSFALGLESWDTNLSAAQAAGATATPYTLDSFDGDGFCVQVTTSVAGQGIEQIVPALLPDSFYELNIWIKVLSGATDQQVVLYDSTNSILGWTQTIPTTIGEWVMISTPIGTGSTANINLICSIQSATGAASEFLVDTGNLWQYTQYTYQAMSLTESSDSTNFVVMGMDTNAGNVTAQLSVEGAIVTSMNLAIFDPIQHAFWRIREYAGTFSFDTSPDGGTWTNQGSLTYPWSSKKVDLSFTTWYFGSTSTPYTPMEVSNVNTTNSPLVRSNGQLSASVNQGSLASGSYNVNAANTVALQNAYLEIPNMAIFMDLLKQSQTRGVVTIVQPTFTASTSSGGTPWLDSASLIITNGNDLESQLTASAAAINGDWVMYPNFQLYVGNDGELGEDRSAEVTFYSSGQIISHDRTRARDQIYNYIVAADGTGNIAYQVDPSSVAQWNIREQYVQSSAATDVFTLEAMANATLNQYKDEISQRTLQVPPDLPGRTVFVDYQLGDWVGIQNSDLSSVDTVRVVAIAVSIDGSQDLATVELTLETRIQLFVERMNVLLQKIGQTADSQVLAPPGASAIFVQQNIAQNGLVGTYQQIVGDGVTTAFVVSHGLETQNVTVTARDNSAGNIYYPGTGTFTLLSGGIDQVTVTFAVAPTVGQYTVVVRK